MTKRTPKKTDAIEVRVSPEEKARLKRKASELGLTISALIRGRLADIFADAEPTEARALAEGFMSRLFGQSRTLLVSRPALISALGAAVLGALVFAAPSQAEALRVAFSAQLSRDGSAATNQSVIQLDYGQTFEVEVRDPGADGERYKIRVSAQPAQDAHEALLSSQIVKLTAEGENIVATPSLLVRYGEPAQIQIGAPGAPQISVRVVIAKA